MTMDDEYEMTEDDLENLSPSEFRQKIKEGQMDAKIPQDSPWMKTTIRYDAPSDTFTVGNGVFKGSAAVMSMMFEWGVPNGTMSYALKHPDTVIQTFCLRKKQPKFLVTDNDIEI